MNLTLFGFCFLGIIIALGQAQRYAGPAPKRTKFEILKAANDNPNCDCQCDNYVWTTNGGDLMGNCER